MQERRVTSSGGTGNGRVRRGTGGTPSRRPIAVAIDPDGAEWPYWGRRVTRVSRVQTLGRWGRTAPYQLLSGIARTLTRVRPTRRRYVERRFGSSPSDVAAARGFARLTAMRWGVAPEELELLVDEVVTNAVVHGHSSFSVAITLLGRTARVEVSDRSPALPYVPDAGLHSVHGRGLLIVDHLAHRWGYQAALNGGKRVWAELRVREAPSPAGDGLAATAGLQGASGEERLRAPLQSTAPADTAGMDHSAPPLSCPPTS